MYDIGRKPKKSEAFARVICHIAVKERGLSINALSGAEIEGIADDALRRYPKICDVRFRQRAIGRVRLFQRKLYAVSSFGIGKRLIKGSVYPNMTKKMNNPINNIIHIPPYFIIGLQNKPSGSTSHINLINHPTATKKSIARGKTQTIRSINSIPVP